MKAKYVMGAIAAALVVGGLWLARDGKPAPEIEKSSVDVGAGAGAGAGTKTPEAGAKEKHTLRPPDHLRTFRDMTPEQRVEQARKGHGPGG